MNAIRHEIGQASDQLRYSMNNVIAFQVNVCRQAGYPTGA